MKKFATLVVIVLGLAALGFADVATTLNETFASGATFTGTVTFLNDYSNLTAVNGTLSGGGYGTDTMTWIWNPNFNYASGYGPQYGGNFLMEGFPIDYQYWITITWDFSNAPSLVLASPGGALNVQGGNNINYSDPLVSGYFGASTPEPGTLLLLGSGVAGLASTLRRKLIG